ALRAEPQLDRECDLARAAGRGGEVHEVVRPVEGQRTDAPERRVRCVAILRAPVRVRVRGGLAPARTRGRPPPFLAAPARPPRARGARPAPGAGGLPPPPPQAAKNAPSAGARTKIENTQARW